VRNIKEKLSFTRRHRKGLALWVFLAFFTLGMAGLTTSAYAGCGCTGSNPADCQGAAQMVQQHHISTRENIMNFLATKFNQHRNWMVNTFFKNQILPALQKMTAQLSAVAAHQVFIVGTFFDAENQLETQRVFQELQVAAHKDYQPSEDFCWFGTGVRSLAPTEARGELNTEALNAIQMSRQLGNANTSGGVKPDQDKDSRWEAFVDKYCDPKDNNWLPDVTGTGLTLVCNSGGNSDRINIDVDYTRLIDGPRTLDVTFDNGGASTADEEDVLALSSNLYGHDVLNRNLNAEYLRSRSYQPLYMALRAVAAKRNVAQNSYNALVGLKAAGSSDVSDGADAPKTREFLAAIVKELGVTDANEVYKIIGENPSYYAQLELLAKKIYQNPDFYANLYDKPANVKRKSVALKAIDLMLDRAIYESQLRQEMAMSVLLSAKLKPLFNEVNEDLSTATRE